MKKLAYLLLGLILCSCGRDNLATKVSIEKHELKVINVCYYFGYYSPVKFVDLTNKDTITMYTTFVSDWEEKTGYQTYNLYSSCEKTFGCSFETLKHNFKNDSTITYQTYCMLDSMTYTYTLKNLNWD
jgi:hypothetical protein